MGKIISLLIFFLVAGYFFVILPYKDLFSFGVSFSLGLIVAILSFLLANERRK